MSAVGGGVGLAATSTEMDKMFCLEASNADADSRVKGMIISLATCVNSNAQSYVDGVEVATVTIIGSDPAGAQASVHTVGIDGGATVH
jgi:hypothetical protein